MASIISSKKENLPRPFGHFPPSIWGDCFMNFNAQDYSEKLEEYGKEISALKEEVRAKLVDNSITDHVAKMKLIDAVERLGVSYHYEKEIEGLVQQIFKAYAKNNFEGDDDLHTTALLFRAFRQHGYKMPCDVYSKFKGIDGKLKKELRSDINGIISLYEAAHLSIKGEEILEEALVFTTHHLKEMVAYAATNSLSAQLIKQVKHALKQPLHTGIPRVETKHFISFYEEEEARDETLLHFAKIDYNMLQILHQQEPSHFCKWCMEWDFARKLPYTRNRSVECYFWSMAMYFEPHYFTARMLLAKVLHVISIVDDTYDAYGTFEELQALTNAFDRWDISAIENLPTDYLKFLFQLVINVYDEIEKEMSTEGRPYAASYAKERIKDLIGSYFVEVTWLKAGYVPTFEEYMRNGRITNDSQIIITSSFIGMKDMADQKAFDWVISGSKTVRATEVIGRLMNDIVSHEEEQTRAEGHVASGVECYMKEHHMNRERAVEEIKAKIKCAWKEINEEFPRPTPMPMHILMRALNLVRTEHVFYKDIDGYTYSRGVKDDIMATYAAPIPI